MTWTVTIAPGLPGDEESIDRLLMENGLPEVAFIIGAYAFLVVKNEGKIVGCGALEGEGPNKVLRSLAIHQEFRGRGLGIQVVRELVDRAVRRSCDALYLLTTDAQGFFKRLGFREAERISAPKEIQNSEQFRSSECAAATMMSFKFGPQGGRS